MSQYPSIECEEVLRHLFAYIDGELDSAQQEQIGVHLGLCRSCFSRAEFERRLKAHMRSLGHDRAPAELERRIRALVDQLPAD